MCARDGSGNKPMRKQYESHCINIPVILISEALSDIGKLLRVPNLLRFITAKYLIASTVNVIPSRVKHL